MFDFRYHVASLAAVFVALVLGILVGIGLSGRGFVDDAERSNLKEQIRDLTLERDAARGQLDAATRRQEAMLDYAERTYPVLVPGRLDDRRVALVFVGGADAGVAFAVSQAVADAGGRVVRTRALTAPIRAEELQRRIRDEPALGGYEDELENLGRDLGLELVRGSRTPLWDALSDALLEERSGAATGPVDGVVLARTAPPQAGATKTFLAGLYRGLAGAGVPAVGVDPDGAERPAVPAFARAGLSTVDTIEAPAGRLALVLLLGGARPGQYGVEEEAEDGVLPPVEPIPTAT